MQALTAKAAGLKRCGCPALHGQQHQAAAACLPVACASASSGPAVLQPHSRVTVLAPGRCSRSARPYRTWSTTTAASQAAALAAPADAAPPADPCLELTGIQARSVGALLGSMCGNALGAQVEPEKHYRLARLFPDGMQDMSWSFDISPEPLPPGHVTGDYITMLAVALSIARSRGADTMDIINCFASSYLQTLIPGHTVRYSPYTQLALESLASGTNPFLLAHHVEGYMAVTPSRASQSCSHRPDRQLHGTTDFTAVLRAVPIGLAYREASSKVLGAAVDAAVLLTHPSEEGREGAVVIATAVAWLTRADPTTSSPRDLLAHLLACSTHSPNMTAKLQLLQQRLPRMQNLGHISNWSHFWASAEWSHFTGTANLLWKQNLAVQGTQAAAVALWVVLCSWKHPKQAVMLAASLGGYAGTTGALVGALVGALHGCTWIPKPWWDQLLDHVVDHEGLTELEKLEMEEEGIEELGSVSTSPRSSVDQGSGATESEGSAVDGADLADQPVAAGDTKAADKVESEATADTGDATAAAEGIGPAEASEEEGPLRELRVGKHAVVALGHELAALSCIEAPRLLQ